MSSDRAALLALAGRTGQELRYFELVALRFEGRTDQVFLCVGKHALYLVRRSLGGLYNGERGGEIFFAHIDRVVEDSQSEGDLIIMMNEGRSAAWPSEKLFVVSESRSRLVEHIAVAWQTDVAWRLGIIAMLPRTQMPLRKRPQRGLLHVKPFQGCKVVHHQGYSFFVPEGYKASNAKGGIVGQLVDEQRELQLALRVHDVETLQELEASGRDHIRWVAMEYRQSVTESLKRVMLLRNAFYLKRMNLVNDMACWTGWEVQMNSETSAIVAIFVRRQYVPPLLDAAQDLAVILTCPVHILLEGIMTEHELLVEARNCADSIAPQVRDCTQHQTLYREMIQAKLDALLYNEDALSWMDSSLGLVPSMSPPDPGSLALRRPAPEAEAWAFLKSILTVLQEENALPNSEILAEIPENVRVDPKPMNILTPMRAKAGGGVDDESNPVINAWIARVARFFGHCVDGFLLGKRFTLYELTSAFLVTEKSRQKINSVILFLLHARPKDMTQPYVPTSIRHYLHDLSFFQEYSFNDRVMQSLLELGWISKSLAKLDAPEDRSASKAMSLDYARFLAQLLMSQTSSPNLKASVCRQIISANHSQAHLGVLLPAVMETLNQRSLYLKTYATVTLVNLSGQNEAVQNIIMTAGIGPMCIEHLKSQDDDLTHYSLVLLANITKSAYHHDLLRDHDLVDTVADVVLGSPAVPSKFQILAEVSSVVGQLCNDEKMWEALCKESRNMVERLLDIFSEVPAGSRVKSKVMFALRQICHRPRMLPGTSKETIGEVIPGVLDEFLLARELIDRDQTPDLDCVSNAIFLLATLSISKKNCETMAEHQVEEALEAVMSSPLCHTHGPLALSDSARDRLHQLWTRLSSLFHAGDLHRGEQGEGGADRRSKRGSSATAQRVSSGYVNRFDSR